jgi:hypothetical protein
MIPIQWSRQNEHQNQYIEINSFLLTRKGVKILDSLEVVLVAVLPWSLCLFATGASSSARMVEGIFYSSDRDAQGERAELQVR